MRSLFYFFSLILLFAGPVNMAQADSYHHSEGFDHLVVTASNDPTSNALLVYDAFGNLLHAIPTGGQGGVTGNAGGVTKYGKWIAVVNFNSQSVSIFGHKGDNFGLVQIIPTLSKPVSVAFGHHHLYILGLTTVESHQLHKHHVVVDPDGSARLLLADGSSAQVGVLEHQLIITEKSNMLEVADLLGGALTGAVTPIQLPPPPNNNEPFGLVTRDDSAYVTIAHSDEVALVRNDRIVTITSSDNQHAPCWLALTKSWLFASNAASHSVSRYNVFGNKIILAEPVAAQTVGASLDIAAEDRIVAVIDLGAGVGHLSQFRIGREGNLELISTVDTASHANGVAILDRGNE